MDTQKHLKDFKERLLKLKYEAIDLEQILMLLINLEARKKVIEYA